MANQSLKDVRATLAAATAAAIDEIRAGREVLIAKRDELKALTAAPLPLKEAEARVGPAVKELGRAWLVEHGRKLLGVPLSAFASMGAGPVRRRSHALAEANATGPCVLPLEAKDGVPFGALCAGDPAAAERLLVGMLRAAYAGLTPGPALADRAKKIAQLEAELAALAQADEVRCDEAIALGLKVAVRPDVQRRRAAEADERQRQERIAAERAARQHALDERHEGERAG